MCICFVALMVPSTLEARLEMIFQFASTSTMPELILATHSSGDRSFSSGPSIFNRITDAIAAERQIKGWGRAKKEALIRSDWTEVSRLSQRRAGRRSGAKRLILRGSQELAPPAMSAIALTRG